MQNQFKESEVYGNDLTIQVISRTEKTVTIKTTAWGIKRVKIRKWNDETESIMFKAWIILATENFDFEEAQRIAFDKSLN